MKLVLVIILFLIGILLPIKPYISITERKKLKIKKKDKLFFLFAHLALFFSAIIGFPKDEYYQMFSFMIIYDIMLFGFIILFGAYHYKANFTKTLKVFVKSNF